jgi:peptide deformylase
MSVSKTKNIAVERCPSFPKLSCKIERFDRVTVEYLTASKTPVTKTLDGFAARIFQHEMDHMIGNSMLFS